MEAELNWNGTRMEVEWNWHRTKLECNWIGTGMALQMELELEGS